MTGTVSESKAQRRRPALIQADIARAIRAAKQTGAAEVEIKIDGASIVVRIAPSTADKNAVELSEVVL